MSASGGESATGGTVRVESALRPRALGEICDIALESLRRDLAVVATASLVVNAPLVAAVLGLVYGVAVLGKANVPFVLPLAALSSALTLARPLAQGAVAAALRARIEEGREPTLGAAYRTALAHGVSTCFAGVAFWTASLGAGLVYVIPGIFAAGWLALAVPTAAVEGKGPLESVGRGMRLLKGHTGRSVALVFLVLVVYAILAANAFCAVYGVLLAGEGLLGLDLTYWKAIFVPTNGLFATAVLLAIYLAVEPWKSCVFYHLHLDQRVRFEALDLVRAAEALAPAPAEPAASAAGAAAA